MEINGSEFFKHMQNNRTGSFELLTDATHSIFRFKKGTEFEAKARGSWQIDIKSDEISYKDIFMAAIRNEHVVIKVKKS